MDSSFSYKARRSLNTCSKCRLNKAKPKNALDVDTNEIKIHSERNQENLVSKEDKISWDSGFENYVISWWDWGFVNYVKRILKRGKQICA